MTDLGTATAAASWIDYAIGGKNVSASQRLKALQELRAMYQGLLDAFPKEIARVHAYDIDRDGTDESDLEGDQ